MCVCICMTVCAHMCVHVCVHALVLFHHISYQKCAFNYFNVTHSFLKRYSAHTYTMADENLDGLRQLAEVTLGHRNMTDSLHDDLMDFCHEVLLLDVRVHVSRRHDDLFFFLTTNIGF